MVLGGRSGVAYTTLVRRLRNASARIELVAWCEMRAKLPGTPPAAAAFALAVAGTSLRRAGTAPRLGTRPSVGTRSMVSIWRGSRMLVSRYSNRNATTTPPTRPSRQPTIRLRPVRGLERRTGTSARSTTTRLESSSDAETEVSFSRVDSAV